MSWDAAVALALPSAEYVKIAEVVWAGATVQTADITMTRFMFFEGDEDPAVAAFAHVWGDGVNDRDVDRGEYGITSLYMFAQAVRRQLDDMIGGATGWFNVPAADLDEVRDHIDLTTDAHSSDPTWTGSVTADEFVRSGSAAVGHAFSHTDLIHPATRQLGWDVTGQSRYSWFSSAASTSNPVYIDLRNACKSLRAGGGINIVRLYTGHAHVDVDATITWTLQERSITAVSGAWTDIDTGTIGAGGTVTGVGAPDSDDLVPTATPWIIGVQSSARLKLELTNAVNDFIYLHGGVVVVDHTKLAHT